ncbi:hypothetical protein [Streptomyces cavernicola]|uniref:Uncharacterized protein n=1 Tax=Streptomyces cavernicola TaxID=3043613 RepID=A0ABT6S722_9ACTN|nr:hypothetical protein [Streptomyces sp. B-S-A6]MDI3403815.1 hypothetical protein [Streptomyces sp. B-S-A6]
MSDLQFVWVCGAAGGVLLGLAARGVARRRRSVRKASAPEPRGGLEAAADHAELRRLARRLDRDRDELRARGHKAEAAYRARAAAEQWQRLVAAQPGRFQGERHAALVRLSELLVETGQFEEAARVRQEAAEVAWRGSRGPTLPGTPPGRPPRGARGPADRKRQPPPGPNQPPPPGT